MKRIIAVLLLVIILSACSSQNVPSTTTDASESAQANYITMLDEGIWPENTYTDGLPVPPGTVSWAMLDTKHENCTIKLVDMSETDFNDYMELLKQEGFSLIEDISEEIKGQDYVSIGSLLSNGEKGLSISYIPNNFMIYISFL